MGLTGPRAEPQLDGLAKHLAKKNQPCTDEIGMLMECMMVSAGVPAGWRAPRPACRRRAVQPLPSPLALEAPPASCPATAADVDRFHAQKHEAAVADSSCARQRAALAFCMAQSKGKQDPLARIGQQVKRLSRFMRRFGF
jgi:hypothetical protein